MNIGVLTTLYPSASFPFEGIFAERRWRGMLERGHRVRVVHPLPRTSWPLAFGQWAKLAALPAREERMGIGIEYPRYWHLPRSPRGNAKRLALAGCQRLLRGIELDVVVCDYAWPASAAAPMLRERNLACVVSGRGSDILQVAGEAGLGAELRNYLRAAGHWCAVSQDLLNSMDELGGGRGWLVPNGVDVKRFSPGERGAARRALNLPQEIPFVLVVGHLIARKDPLLALRSFLAGAPGNAQLVFVGRGPLEAELQEEIERLGAQSQVSMVGEAGPERLVDWYRAANCLLLTSSREGRPNVVLEALACGLPVLATDAGGTGELLQGLSGTLAKSRSADELGGMLRELLQNPPDSVALRERVLPLSWAASTRALEHCLQAAVDAGRGQREQLPQGKL